MSIWIVPTALAGVLGGILATRLKIPGGRVIGAMFVVAAFNIVSGAAYFPWYAKIFAQSVAGAFIALPVTIEHFKSIRTMLVPAALVIGGMFTVSLLYGFLGMAFSDMNPMTAFLASSPGGLSDLVLISGDLGADPVQVSVLQTVRAFSSMGLCPIITKKLAEYVEAGHLSGLRLLEHQAVPAESAETSTENVGTTNLIVTLLIAIAAGCLGELSGLPAGPLLFSLISVCAFNLKTRRGYISLSFRNAAQVCAGIIIGTGITLENLLGIKSLIWPLVIIVIGNIILTIVLGILVCRFGGLDLRTALLASIPAGASDMALIANDLDGDGAKVALLQTLRLVTVIGVFPQIYLLICRFL